MVQSPKPAYGIGREKLTIPVMPPRPDDVFHVADIFKSKPAVVNNSSSGSSSSGDNNSSNNSNSSSNNKGS